MHYCFIYQTALSQFLTQNENQHPPPQQKSSLGEFYSHAFIFLKQGEGSIGQTFCLQHFVLINRLQDP